MKKYCFLVIFFLTVFRLLAQDKTSSYRVLNAYQDTLKNICKKLYAPGNSDVEKKAFNKELLRVFERALTLDDAFTFAFDSLTGLARLASPDKSFRIINWNVPYDDGTQEYFGFIQNKHTVVKKRGLFSKERTTTIKLHPLIDKSAEIKNPENAVSDNKNWYGMLYYAIIPKKTKKKVYYTLLAWDGNDKLSKKKIIDVLTFDDKGIPHFGADIFNVPKKNPKRIVFEFAANCVISLKYNDKKDILVFDHLSPENPSLEGQFQYYCTDMSYDGFEFKKGKWNYIEDVNVTNDKDRNDKFYNDPHSTRPTNSSNTIISKEKKPKK
jgi:hypothetical protein